MINRVLIRTKVLHMVYAYHQNNKENLAKAEKELFYSLEKTYELYLYLLLLVSDISYYAEQRIDLARSKYLPSPEEQNPNLRFVNNAFLAQLRQNTSFRHEINNRKLSWAQYDTVIKKLYDQIQTAPFYIEYMQAENNSYEADKEIWRKIFKQIIQNNSYLEEAMEEQSIYWNDDLNIVLTFVLKTIKRFEQDKGENQALLPMYKDESDRQFALDLFRASIKHTEEYRSIITEAVQNWELERLALMDLIILQVALAEIMEIKDIPLSVSFNEYIDIAKSYSTEKSGLFINGTLDHIVRELKKENKLFKA
ncbi:MAG: transcription antitermination factor NusB [Bacteroidales bacterium]|jgi:N utilization substance protein B|nr:transcription antitermination factor NusB [Bacteroidales bacterium]MDD2617437.1 transcription antitermination factor NusB [Bacteroidales bacterium]MDD4640337.1 transcription antitermination factor NusB [Bacteroidales bacterium]